MSIININQITPKNIRGVMPKQYKNRPYKKLKEGDKIVITDLVFSVYQAKAKDGTPMVFKNGDVAGQPVLNTTVYLGLDDGSYTSVKNDVAEYQLSALVGYEGASEIGYYPYTLDTPETVTVITTKIKMGRGERAKDVEVFAFQ